MAKASTQGPSGVPAEGAELDKQESEVTCSTWIEGKRGILQSPVSVTRKVAPCPEKGMWGVGWPEGKAGWLQLLEGGGLNANHLRGGSVTSTGC